jgi:hypothetical protein
VFPATSLSAAAPWQRTTLESDARNTRHFRGAAASHCCTTLLTQHTTALHAKAMRKFGRKDVWKMPHAPNEPLTASCRCANHSISPDAGVLSAVYGHGGNSLQGDALVIALLCVGQARVPHPQMDADA